MASTVAASRKHVELSLELKRKLIQEHEHGVPFTLLGKKYHIATSTAANIWRKKDFFLRSRMSGSRKRCNDRSKYKIVNQVTALFVKSMLERNHKIDGEVIKRFARTAAAQCNFKDFHGSNGWLDSFKKRENVCWVRRRGERIPGGHQMNGGEPNGSVAVAHPQLLTARSDSPNLSAAAAAAALAASAAAQQNHHHGAERAQASNGSPRHRQLWPDTTEPAMISSSSGLTTNQQQTQHRRQVQQVSAVLETGGCPRCNVAAAAAAVAALNSSDSVHERDHEIEDWFHGIPFLCQFFEEYQSMHQAPDQPNNQGAVGNAAGGSTAASSISSTSSSSSIQLAPAMTLATSTTTCTSSSSTGGPVSLGPTRSVSDAHELMDSCLAASGASMRTSASMADLQSDSCGSQPGQQLQRAISTEMLDSQQQQQQQIELKQQQQYEMSFESPEVNFSHHQQQQQQQADYPMAISSSSSSNQHQQAIKQEHNNGDHLMEITFAEEHINETNQQLMIKSECCNQAANLQASACTRTGSEASIVSQQDKQMCQQQQQGPGQQNGGQQSSSSSLIVSQLCDYNSDDQEFYLANGRYVPQDAQSDDLLYHDDDHNDCCSDHYEPNASSAAGSRELQSLHDHYQADLSGSNSGCYIDEYEYENISTIRHYPVPNMSLQPQQQQQQVSAGARGFLQRQQLSIQSTNSLEDASFMNPTMASRPPVELGSDQSFLTGSNQLNPNTTGEYSRQEQSQQQQAEQQQQQQQQQQHIQQQAPQQTTADQQLTNNYSSLMSLQDHDHGIEHADHEEHNLLHNALMRSPEKLKLIDSIITLLNYASNYNQRMLSPLLEIKRCIERDLEVVLSDTTNANPMQNCCETSDGGCQPDKQQRGTSSISTLASCQDNLPQQQMVAGSGQGLKHPLDSNNSITGGIGRGNKSCDNLSLMVSEPNNN